MFSISSLYDDYAHQTKGSLIGRIKDELSSLQGPRCASLIADLDRCIRITEDYTNNHQKSESAPKNDNGETIRRSGEAYINHPLRVTLILIHERLFDDDVVKAAIMHDLFEDTDYTYANAVENFGENVANLINCVTNVSDDSTEQYDEGVSAEERDYSGIINRCKEYPIAFYIKFADRLDNLMTLGAMPIKNQKQKVEETKYIVSLLKFLKANRFLKYFQNVIFKIKESFRPEGKDDSYAIIRDRLKQLNAFASIKETEKKINAVFAKHFREIRVKAPTVFEVYSHLTENGIDIRKFSQSDFQYDFFFISSSGNDVPALSSVLSEFISGPLHDFAVVKIDKNESGGEVDEKRFTFVDNFKNRFQVHLLSTVNYTVQMYGLEENDLPAVYPDTVYDTFAREQMVTFTPERDHPIMLPVGATAIDFAFKIREDVLSQMVGAEVNGKQCDAYVRLKPNDVVRIITVENPRDRLPIEWIVNCETKDARRFIYGKIKRTIAQKDATIKELEKKPAQNNS